MFPSHTTPPVCPTPGRPLLRMHACARVEEREALQLIAEGNSSKEVATLMGVSLKTIESHRSSLMNKLGIHKVANLVRFAVREGLVEP